MAVRAGEHQLTPLSLHVYQVPNFFLFRLSFG